jgi:hypothetical protein
MNILNKIKIIFVINFLLMVNKNGEYFYQLYENRKMEEEYYCYYATKYDPR